MKKLTAKHTLFIILVVGFFVIVYYQMSEQSLFGGKASVASSSSRGARSDKNPVKYDVPSVKIDLLSQNSATFDPTGRNLFNYDKPKPTPAELEAIRKAQEEAQRRAEEERKRREEELRKQAEQAQKDAEQRSHLPPPPAPPPSVTFKYIGYIGNPDDKIAVLEEGKDLYFGKEGETVKEHFLIVNIDFDSLIVGYNKPEWQKQTKVLPLGK